MMSTKLNFKKICLFLVTLFFIFSISFSGLVLAQGVGNPPVASGPILVSPYPQNFTLVSFLNFILNNIVLPIGAVIAVLFLVYAGFLFVTARGNETQLEHAKTTFKWTVIGIAILFGSTVIATGIKNTICQIASNIPGFCNTP